MPHCLPNRRTAPDIHSNSVGLLACRSWYIDATMAPGKSAIRFSCCSIASSGKSTPIARPTAIDSSSDATITGRISGSSRSSPMGFRVDVVMLDIVAISKNFIHTSDSTFDEYVGLRPALSAASFSRCPRSDIVPSCSPKAKEAKVPVCRIKPGSAITAAI